MNTATLRNWGGSVALPIPRSLLSLLGLDAGQEVDMDVQDGKIIIQPAKPKYSLDQLMKEHKALKLPKDKAWLEFEDLPSERM